MDTAIDTAKDPNRRANGTFRKGHKIGHRFEKGHPQYPMRTLAGITAHARLKRKIIRDLKKQFGSKLSMLRMQHIHSIGDLSARLQLLGEAADPIAAATLANTIHRHLEALNT